MTMISNIHIDAGYVTAMIDGTQQKIDPSYLLMQVLANKRKNLTSQYINFISDMNSVNQRADRLEDLRAKVSAYVSKMGKDDKMSPAEMRQKRTDSGVQVEGNSVGDFDWKPYKGKDGNYSKESLQDMVEAIRNKIQTLNNLNSQTQVKVKMIDEYRNETIEWQNSLQDRLERVFSKINQ